MDEFTGLDPEKCRTYASELEAKVREVVKVGVEIRRIDFQGQLGMGNGPCGHIVQCDKDISAAVRLLRRKADDVEMLEGTPSEVKAILAKGITDPQRARTNEQLVEDAAALLVTDADGPARMIPFLDELERRGVPADEAQSKIWGRTATAVAVATDLALNTEGLRHRTSELSGSNGFEVLRCRRPKNA